MRRSLATFLNRHWPTLTVAGAFLSLSTVIMLAVWPVPLEEKVRRIQPGMTRAEAEGAMGVPAGDYSNFVIPTHGGTNHENRPLVWRWDDAIVKVWFDADGHVTQTEYHPLSPIPVSPWNRLKLWFGS